jgi:hypothetical protein
MSRQNVEIITAMLDRARTDPSALAAVLHETAEFDLAGINPVVEIIDAEDSVVVSIDSGGGASRAARRSTRSSGRSGRFGRARRCA